MSPLNWMFQGLVVALFALCSLLLGKSPPEFARRATSFLCWCKERRQRKHLKTHLASSQSGCSTTGDRPQLASRLEQFPLDARRTFHESAAHTSPHGMAVILRRRVGSTCDGSFALHPGGTVRAARRVVARARRCCSGCRVIARSNGFSGAFFCLLFFAPAKKRRSPAGRNPAGSPAGSERRARIAAPNSRP